MSSKQQIKKFNLKDLKPYSFIVIIGTRGSGKTTIIKEILYNFRHIIRTPLLVSATSQQTGAYSGIIPDLLIHEEYKPEIMEITFQNQLRLRNDMDNGKVRKDIKHVSAIVLDDFCGTNPVWKTDPSLEKLIYNGRHPYLFIIMCVQTPKDIPHKFRDNIDYIFVTNISTEKRKKFLFDNFWDGKFGEFNVFINSFNSILKVKHNFIIINAGSDENNKQGNKVKDISDYIYWARARDPKTLPKKRLGNSFYWDINNKFFNKNYLMSKYSNESVTKQQAKGPEFVLAE